MINEVNNTIYFWDYFEKWIEVYKKGAIRDVTMNKYYMTLSWIKKLAPTLLLKDMTRIAYQQILNEYALEHERQTTMDFHHQLKGAIMDAVDEGLIPRDPTRKAIIKGKQPRAKKLKYLNQFELHSLLSTLYLKDEITWDWFILLVAKTGMRFSEALAITPADFDFAHQTVSVSKTWDYKGKGGFSLQRMRHQYEKFRLTGRQLYSFHRSFRTFLKIGQSLSNKKYIIPPLTMFWNAIAKKQEFLLSQYMVSGIHMPLCFFLQASRPQV